MEKKVEDILEAFEHYRFEDALRQIDQLMKKVGKDTKKKTSLTENDNRTIQMIKCGSLASIGKIHQANQIIENYFTQKVLSQMTDKQKFMFISIAELSFDQKIMNKIQVLNKTGKQDVRFQRFMLSYRLFSQVSKSFLKQYAKQKRQQDGLAQIFLEYVNQLNKVQPIESYYSKDLIIQPNKQLNLKMVELFFMKYFNTIKLNELKNVKLRSSIIDLRIRFAINSGKTQDAKKYYIQNLDYIEQHFVYLRSIRDMPDNILENHRFYIQNCGTIFRRNLQIQKYVPLYDFYDEFLDFIVSEQITKDFSLVQQIQQKQEQISSQNLYNFAKISNEQILSHYYKSLSQQLRLLTIGQKYQVAKKSDYYKISIKGLMLQLLKIQFLISHKVLTKQQSANKLMKSQSFNKIIDNYFIHFAKTLTYPNQLKNYIPFLKDKFESIFQHVTSEKPKFKLPINFQKDDDNLILLINVLKLVIVLNKEKLTDWKQIQNWAQLCWSFYQQFIKEVQQSKRRQKGQVFLCDEFIIILCDIVIYHIENLLNFDSIENQSFIQSVLIKIMAILDYATQISPFNGYLKLKLIYACQKLNYFDKLIDTYISLDIKSVQLQTLGYFLINPMNNFNLYSQSDDKLIRMVRSYQQNHRETAQYCLKGLKAGTTHQVFEYFSYQKRLQKSFSKMILFYTLYLKYQRKQHSQFYLNWIQKKLNQYKQNKISFNCDTKTMQNLILSLDSKTQSNSSTSLYNQYYGYLNSPQVFKLEIQFRKLQSLFRLSIDTKSVESQKHIDQLLAQIQTNYSIISKTSNISQLYDIRKSFYAIDEYLNKGQNTVISTKLQNETFSFSKIRKDFIFYTKLAQLKLSFFNSFKACLLLLKQTQNNQILINDAKNKFRLVFQHINNVVIELNDKMSWRQQIKNCWLMRQTLLTENNIVKMMNEQGTKIKKLPKSIKNTISQFSNDLQKLVLDSVIGIKFSQKFKIDLTILNLPVDKKYLNLVQQTDEMLRRTSLISLKQAKDLLLK